VRERAGLAARVGHQLGHAVQVLSRDGFLLLDLPGQRAHHHGDAGELRCQHVVQVLSDPCRRSPDEMRQFY